MNCFANIFCESIGFKLTSESNESQTNTLSVESDDFARLHQRSFHSEISQQNMVEMLNNNRRLVSAGGEDENTNDNFQTSLSSSKKRIDCQDALTFSRIDQRNAKTEKTKRRHELRFCCCKCSDDTIGREDEGLPMIEGSLGSVQFPWLLPLTCKKECIYPNPNPKPKGGGRLILVSS